jgi:phenylacetic acid degradation operon negative regulatory protein
MEQPAPPSARDLPARLGARAGSLIITVFGDSVAPRGGSIWLGSLIRLMAPLGLSARLVRTGVYRLSREGWLAARSRGRKAYYHLTPEGEATFAEADRRIYAAEAPAWDGEWTLVHLLPGLAAARRHALLAHLHGWGYGRLGPGLFVHTGRRGLEGLAGPAAAIVVHGRLADIAPAASPREVAALAWDLERLNAAYAAFTETFSPFERDLPSSEEAFTLTSLLVHEYRRILLHDPQLPADILPSAWAGHEARRLAARLYLRHVGTAGRFIAATMESWHGPAPEPAPSHFQRFRAAPSRSPQAGETP